MSQPPAADGPHGNPARHLPEDTLIDGLNALPTVPADRGRVAMIVSRREDGVRETPERAVLTPEAGVPGDGWSRRLPLNPDAQITAMRADVGALIANGQELTLFGDNLIVELDLSARNLPVGSRVRAGDAILEVTPKPHTGCKKYAARFGQAALRFISRLELREDNLRGIYFRVVTAGEVAVGDPIEVLSRPE